MFDKLRKWLPSGITMLIFPVIHMIIYETTNHFPLFGRYNEVYCRLDEVLPLVKWFMIPYCLWFVFIAGTVLLFFLTDMTELKRYVKYLMITVIEQIAVGTIGEWAEILKDPWLIPRMMDFFYF